jgi:hypothetical protein
VGIECIDILYDYLRAFPPPPHSPILTGLDGLNETSAQIQLVLNATGDASSHTSIIPIWSTDILDAQWATR